MITAEKIQSELYEELCPVEYSNALTKIGYSESSISEMQNKYPLHRIVTENKVNKICDKYGLKFAEMEDFIGAIPKLNAQHVDNFMRSYYTERMRRYIKTTFFWQKDTEYKTFKFGEDATGWKHNEDYDTKSHSFFIIAPPSEIVTSKKRERNGKQKVDDPIILACERYNPWVNDNIFIVVTAWGKESKDVTNSKLN